MTSKYFGVPFANAGDKTSIPDASQPSGDVSFQDGWTPDYTKDQATDATAKDVSRQSENYFKFVISEALKEIQERGFKPYDALVNYPVGAIIPGPDNILYECLIKNGPDPAFLPVVDPVGDLTGTWIKFVSEIVIGENLLINPEMLINQDAFAGGAIVAGDYGFDMWKAATGGANMSATAAGLITLTSGSIEQIIEDPKLAGKTVNISARLTSGSLSYDVEGVSGTLTGGVGIQTVSIEIPGGSTGDITFKLSVSGATVFSDLKFEVGGRTPFTRRSADEEISKCYRNYFKSLTDETEILSVLSGTQATNQKVTFPVPMRSNPSIVQTYSSGSAALGVVADITTEAFITSFTGNDNAVIRWSWVADARP